MKVVILSDVHANLPALEAVLEDVARTAPGAPIWHCGDVVGYGASPNEVVAELQRVGATGVMGNHDLAALATTGLRPSMKGHTPRRSGRVMF